ncbi:HCP-like protein [Suillus weaverae]|nr:HCP-like protein [Suillus weaverae]
MEAPNQVRLVHSSPLDTLVRRTSSKRQAVQRKEHEARKQAAALNSSSPVPYSSRSTGFPSSLQVQAVHANSSPRPFATSPSVPDSPLLHSQFRNSTASNADYLNRKSFLSLTDEPDGYYDELVSYYEENSMYSLQSHTPSACADSRRSWVEPASGSANVLNIESSVHDMHLFNSSTPVPTVVVSKPQDVNKQAVVKEPKPGGRSPIVDPTPRINFSRPGRPPIFSSEEQKRQVLERNSQRTRSPQTALTPLSFAPITPQTGVFPENQLLSPTPQSNACSPGSYLQPNYAVSSPTLSSPSHVHLPHRPPSVRPSSPASLYSTSYSFYRLSDGSPSPTGNSKFPAHSPSPPGNRSPSTEPSTPQEYLQLGIQYHEANKLQDSAFYFEKSAKEQGGCGIGMLLWGLTLRHGWGCEKNEKSGFKWLTKAAESAVDDLGKAREGMDVKAVRSELVLAIYEVGQCFFHGWGVVKDHKMAVSYYRVAANLGDGDAQEDLAFCLANGKGCKKDKKEAAKWYRAAVEQGASDVGMAWIYKDKYNG